MENSKRSEIFLQNLFNILTEKHFKNDSNLKSFYSHYKTCLSENPSTDLFQCYMSYILRNFESDVVGKKRQEILDELFYTIVLEEEPEDQTSYDIKERTDAYKDVYKKSKKKDRKVDMQNIKINKKFALKTLSDFISQSGIRIDEDPEQNKECMAEDQEFRDRTTVRIISEIKDEDGRDMPRPQPDRQFGERSIMLEHFNRSQQHIMQIRDQQPAIIELVKKWCYLNTVNFQSRQSVVQSLEFSIPKNHTLEADVIKQRLEQGIDERKDYEVIIPSFPINQCYTNQNYNTTVSLYSSPPIAISAALKKTQKKNIYICTGSQMICGGGADQGLNVKESYLYLTSTYSVTIEKFIHAFPIPIGNIIVCPNVLVFKDVNYNLLQPSDWMKIAVANAPLKFRPTVNIKDLDTTTYDERLFDKNTFMDTHYVQKIRQNLIGTIEASLFLGYDHIVLDDLGVMENGMPAHQTAAIILEVMQQFKGRVAAFYIAVDKARVFDVFKWYFTSS